LFDLHGWEYILHEVTQNVHLVSTPFLQKAKYKKSCGTFCVTSIPTAEKIGDFLAIRRLSNKRDPVKSDVTSIPTAENIGDEIFSHHLSPF
jgi:transcriptional regulatory protein LevR